MRMSRAQYAKERRAQRIAANLCLKDGCNSPPTDGNRRCREHHIQYITYQRNYYRATSGKSFDVADEPILSFIPRKLKPKAEYQTDPDDVDDETGERCRCGLRLPCNDCTSIYKVIDQRRWNPGGIA